LVRACLLGLAFLSALALRSAFNFQHVFRADGVAFQDPDASFHMRTVENLVHHFPHRSGFDPYSAFPHGQPVPTGPFYDLAIGAVAWIAGFGAPSRHLTDIIGAWFPAILGALITIPVYFIGRALFDPIAGLIAAGVIAIFPGLIFNVSRLGYTDHHVAEALLSTLLLLLLISALNATRPRPPMLLSGVVIGAYLATRPAGAFLVLFVEIWAMVQIAWNHFRGKSNRRVWYVTVPPLFLGWLLFLLVGQIIWSDITTMVLWTGMLSITAVTALSEWLRPRPRWLFFAIVLGALAGAGGAALLVKPHLLRDAIAAVTERVGGNSVSQTVAELRPLLTLYGRLSWKPAWDQFTTAWILAPPALLYASWRAFKENSPALLLFSIWSALMLVAGLEQVRNCYYLAINMALLAGFASAQLIRLPGRWERAVACLLVAGALIYPNLSKTLEAARIDTGPSPDWRDALSWLRDQTPEPFNDPSAFDRYFPALAPGATFSYPPSAYGIMNWWDYGHWISAIGRRIPVGNGMQSGAVEAAHFFTATDPVWASDMLRRAGARYVIADPSLPLNTAANLNPSNARFLTMMVWAGLDVDDHTFTEAVLNPSGENEAEPLMVFYPAYYQSMLARLYLFDAEQQTPEDSTWAMAYNDEVFRGKTRKHIIWSQRFHSYDEAQQYVRQHSGRRFVIGGLDPLKSCVPLPKLADYRLAYTSQPSQKEKREVLHAVKIFEYRRPSGL
jgi:dolichyl-diphosphooligosaccharide--protein glycosyltransferase